MHKSYKNKCDSPIMTRHDNTHVIECYTQSTVNVFQLYTHIQHIYFSICIYYQIYTEI